MRQVQIIKCKCGRVFAMCVIPEAYQDAEWMRELRKYVKKGCTVEVGFSKDYSLENCICKKEVTPTLFD